MRVKTDPNKAIAYRQKEYKIKYGRLKPTTAHVNSVVTKQNIKH